MVDDEITKFPSGPPGRVHEGDFERIGEVRATRLNAPRAWQTRHGDTMQASAGDWWVISGDGEQRSVAPESFAKTYKHIEGDRFERTGRVHARQVIASETVKTHEGRVQASRRDWVVTDDDGSQWVVPCDVFERQYQPAVETDSLNDRRALFGLAERREGGIGE